jgi:hypothetical protein
MKLYVYFKDLSLGRRKQEDLQLERSKEGIGKPRNTQEIWAENTKRRHHLSAFLKEGCRLKQGFENEMTNKIRGIKRGEILDNFEYYNVRNVNIYIGHWYVISKTVKLKRARWFGHVAIIGRSMLRIEFWRKTCIENNHVVTVQNRMMTILIMPIMFMVTKMLIIIIIIIMT